MRNHDLLNFSSDVPPPFPVDPRDAARASAMAEITQMRTDLEACHETIRQLRADVHHLEDRVTLLSDERNRLRQEVNIYRTACVELATAQANIGLLTSRAADITARVTELIERVDGTELESDNKTKIDQIVATMETNLAPRYEAPDDTTGQGARVLGPQGGNDHS